MAEPPATPSVTPVASVVAVTDLQRQGQPAAMLPEDVPEGPAPSDARVEQIRSTLAEMMICHRPGNEGQVAAFYSDDFFHRPWVAATVRWNGYQHLWAPEGPEALDFEETRVLEDGRVGVLIRYNDDYSRFVVFVEEDGRWLIDEIVEISSSGETLG
ncbi:MAG TPA: hypothetical protein VGR16_02725 [Thermomicrobiales bacterium]|nr:hypothetical protein [Thermomicrobiales bacterium]